MLTRDDIMEAIRADYESDYCELFNSFSECDRREVSVWASSGSESLFVANGLIWDLFKEGNLEDFLAKVL